MERKLEPPSDRTLDKDVPELREYLKPGDKVLDIGCGPGTITLGVAEAVSPGEVVGVDPVEADIAAARQWASRAAPGARVSFRVGDAHELPIADGAFDVVYSHTVAHFFLDPGAAFREMRRVTKLGGWVVASGVRDVRLRYPRCPNWEKAGEAMGRYYDSLGARFQAGASGPTPHLVRELRQDRYYMVYWDMEAGRKCPSWLAEAGLRDITVEAKGAEVQLAGSEAMAPSVYDMLPWNGAVADTTEQPYFDLLYRRMEAEGFIDPDTLARAREEARAWYQDPRAFHYWVLVFVAGRK